MSRHWWISLALRHCFLFSDCTVSWTTHSKGYHRQMRGGFSYLHLITCPKVGWLRKTKQAPGDLLLPFISLQSDGWATTPLWVSFPMYETGIHLLRGACDWLLRGEIGTRASSPILCVFFRRLFRLPTAASFVANSHPHCYFPSFISFGQDLPFLQSFAQETECLLTWAFTCCVNHPWVCSSCPGARGPRAWAVTDLRCYRSDEVTEQEAAKPATCRWGKRQYHLHSAERE